MTGVNNLGNGNGWLYCTDKNNTKILSAVQNSQEGARRMLNIASVAGPLSANRSAFAIIQVTAAAAAGNLTAITIAGINQIAANVPCVSAVPATVAASWAAAINAFTPSGIEYTAVAVADLVYIFASPGAGATPNGLTPIISTDIGSLVGIVTQSFINGANNTGVIDDNLGLRFFLDPTPATTPAAAPAFPLTFTEITKYVVARGLQSGFVTQSKTISNDGIDTDRYCALTNYVLSTEGGAATDNLAFINPVDHVEGDIVFLRGINPAQATTVISAGSATVVTAAIKNIYLIDNAPFLLDGPDKALMLQFRSDPTVGGAYYELGRSTGTTVPEATILRVNPDGNDTSAIRGRADKPFATVDAAVAALQTDHDLIVLAPSSTPYSLNVALPVGINFLNVTGTRLEGLTTGNTCTTLNLNPVANISFLVLTNIDLCQLSNPNLVAYTMLNCSQVSIPGVASYSVTTHSFALYNQANLVFGNNLTITSDFQLSLYNSQAAFANPISVTAGIFSLYLIDSAFSLNSSMSATTPTLVAIYAQNSQISGTVSAGSTLSVVSSFLNSAAKFINCVITDLILQFSSLPSFLFFNSYIRRSQSGIGYDSPLLKIQAGADGKLINCLIEDKSPTLSGTDAVIEFTGNTNKLITDNLAVETGRTNVHAGDTATQNVSNVKTSSNKALFGANTANAGIAGNIVIVDSSLTIP